MSGLPRKTIRTTISTTSVRTTSSGGSQGQPPAQPPTLRLPAGSSNSDKHNLLKIISTYQRFSTTPRFVRLWIPKASRCSTEQTNSTSSGSTWTIAQAKYRSSTWCKTKWTTASRSSQYGSTTSRPFEVYLSIE